MRLLHTLHNQTDTHSTYTYSYRINSVVCKDRTHNVEYEINHVRIRNVVCKDFIHIV